MSKSLIIILGLFLVLSNSPLSAQETTTDDIQNVLDDLAERVVIASNYTSFSSAIDEVSETINQIYLADSDTPLLNYTSDNQIIQRSILYDDEGNISAQVLGNYELVEGLDDTTLSYQVMTDVRYLDDIYYYRISTDDEDLQQELQLTGEWEIVAPEDIEGLPIANFTNPFTQDITLDLLNIANESSRMTIGSATIDEDTFNTFSFGFNGPEFIALSSQFNALGLPLDTLENNAWQTSLIDSLNQQTNQDIIIISFFLNEDDLLAGFSFEYYLKIYATGEQLENPQIDDINFEINFFRREILNNINQSIPTIETPLITEPVDTTS